MGLESHRADADTIACDARFQPVAASTVDAWLRALRLDPRLVDRDAEAHDAVAECFDACARLRRVLGR